MTTLKIGEIAPEFALTDVDGRTVALSDYRGSPALLVFLRHLG